MRTRKRVVSAIVIAGGLLVSVGWTLARPSGRDRTATGQDSIPLSSAELRRLAAATDAYRTGDSVWVVMAVDRTSVDKVPQVVGVFTNADSAARVAARGGRRYGPFVTPREYDKLMAFVPGRHSPPTIYMDSLPLNVGAMWRGPNPPWLMSDVDSVVIIAYNHRVGTWRASSPGKDIDAVFFTLSAHDKFVFPYYANLYGLETALHMRETLSEYARKVR